VSLSNIGVVLFEQLGMGDHTAVGVDPATADM